MSPAPASPPAPAAELERLRRELEEKTVLIQDIRKDLIHAQLTILELNDTILEKETEKTDATALLGRLELLLEGKINHIQELDRVLNEKIATLRQNLAAETAARDQIIQDLAQKLDAANREIGATHLLAGNYARDLAQAQEQLLRTGQELAEARAALAQTRQELAGTCDTLATTEEARAALSRKVAAMQASWSWKLTAPLRALRRLSS